MNREEKDLSFLRENYRRGNLEKHDLNDSPFVMFKAWMDTAIASELLEPNALTLATCSATGQPSARTVLLKGIAEDGYIFYTNYTSKKGQEIKHNPKACMLFLWKELERQVRIEGNLEKITTAESTAYFHSRPKGSQLGAWASPQSQVITDREILDHSLERLTKQYSDDDKLPLPPFWGGYKLVPHYFEFWQGRENRLHDRFSYTKKENTWLIERLAP
jgi:pyridoxamine 5'-phosphate oxidase